jgi:signal transduction histidine kinase
MTQTLFPDILRSLVTNTMFMTLLLVMMPSNYNKRKSVIFFILVALFQIAASIYFYRVRDYTNLARYIFLLVVIISLISIPVLKVRFTRWLFNLITVTNVEFIIVVLSYTLSRRMPYPPYAHTLLRFLLFLLVIVMYRRYASYINEKLQDQWGVFFITSVAVLVNFANYLLLDGDIETMMKANIVPLMLLIILVIIIYIGIFITLKTLSSEYELRVRDLSGRANEELMKSQMNYMRNMLRIIDEGLKKSRIESHDRRHFDNTLMKLLEDNRTEKAMTLLKEKGRRVETGKRYFCSNATVNAAIAYYAALAHKKGIVLKARLDIPENLPVNELELAIVVANLLENAIQASAQIADMEKRIINFIFVSQPQIVFEIENPCPEEVPLDAEGYPTTEEEGHGLGTRSVVIFVDKYQGQLLYSQKNGIFQVRVVI